MSSLGSKFILLVAAQFAGYAMAAALLDGVFPNDSLLGVSTLQDRGIKFRDEDYIHPNEFYPEDAIPMMQLAPTGIYIGVGSDRALNLPSLSAKVNRIVMLDFDPTVVRWNRINLALIGGAKNLRHYRQLRIKGTWAQVKKVWRDSNSSPTEDEWKWWQSRRAHPDMENFERGPGFRNSYGDVTYTDRFADANYTRSASQFDRLQRLQRSGKIEAHYANLSNLTQMRTVAERIHASGERVSVFDISNAWENGYLGPEAAVHLMTVIAPVAEPRGLAMVTAYWMRNGGFYNGSNSFFGYIAKTFAQLGQDPKPFNELFAAEFGRGHEGMTRAAEFVGTVDGKVVSTRLNSLRKLWRLTQTRSLSFCAKAYRRIMETVNPDY